jgi:hypothetical protein
MLMGHVVWKPRSSIFIWNVSLRRQYHGDHGGCPMLNIKTTSCILTILIHTIPLLYIFATNVTGPCGLETTIVLFYLQKYTHRFVREFRRPCRRYSARSSWFYSTWESITTHNILRSGCPCWKRVSWSWCDAFCCFEGHRGYYCWIWASNVHFRSPRGQISYSSCKKCSDHFVHLTIFVYRLRSLNKQNTKSVYGMMADQDRICTNVYGEQDWSCLVVFPAPYRRLHSALLVTCKAFACTCDPTILRVSKTIISKGAAMKYDIILNETV